MSDKKIDDLRNSLTPSVGFELIMQNESLTKERDTYRQLCVELLEDLKSQVGAFEYEMGQKSLADSRELIEKAEQQLNGEKNGNTN